MGEGKGNGVKKGKGKRGKVMVNGGTKKIKENERRK